LSCRAAIEAVDTQLAWTDSVVDIGGALSLVSSESAGASFTTSQARITIGKGLRILGGLGGVAWTQAGTLEVMSDDLSVSTWNATALDTTGSITMSLGAGEVLVRRGNLVVEAGAGKANQGSGDVQVMAGSIVEVSGTFLPHLPTGVQATHVAHAAPRCASTTTLEGLRLSVKSVAGEVVIRSRDVVNVGPVGQVGPKGAVFLAISGGLWTISRVSGINGSGNMLLQGSSAGRYIHAHAHAHLQSNLTNKLMWCGLSLGDDTEIGGGAVAIMVAGGKLDVGQDLILLSGSGSTGNQTSGGSLPLPPHIST
jgi:hypothetical protein